LTASKIDGVNTSTQSLSAKLRLKTFNAKKVLVNDFCITSLPTRESRRLAGGLKT
jgi:hypothetical protein